MGPITEEHNDSSMESPQLQGVVIITLPPSDNPSKGKTITSIFTLSDPSDPSPSTHQPQQPHNQHNPSNLSAPSSTTPPSHRFLSPRKIFTNGLKLLLGFVGISLLAFLIWNSASPSDALRRFRSENGDDEISSSYVFTLYPKLGSRRKIEIGSKIGEVGRRERLGSVEMVNDGVQAQRSIDVMSKLASSPLFPVRGNVYPDGLYYISLLVGNPPRPYHLDMDTGSDLTWVQCDAPCASCSKGPNPLYKPTRRNMVPSKDLMCAEVQDDEKSGCASEACQECVYEIEYADNSSSRGVLVKDKLQQVIDGQTILNSDFVFGCAYDQKGELSLSPARTDGIIGLSKAKIGIPSQLASQGIIRNVVGHCIANDINSFGYMFLGDDFVPQWGMTWVPMLDGLSTNFYQSKIVKINYGHLSLGSSGIGWSQVVFDSGSSYTYFPKEAYSGLVESLERYLGGGLTLDETDHTLPVCWRANLPIRDLEHVKSLFQPLTLHFERKWWILRRTLQIPPEGYLILSDKGNVCLGILDGSEVHDGSTIILGDISLRGWLVVYDNVCRRIGWSRSDCTKPQSFDSDSLAFF